MQMKDRANIIPNNPGHHIHWQNQPLSALCLSLTEVLRNRTAQTLIVVTNPSDVLTLEEGLRFFYGEHLHVMEYPDWETLAYDPFSPHKDIISNRLTALERLLNDRESVVLTTVNTLLHRMSPRDFIKKHVLYLKVGMTFDTESFRQTLVQVGYYATNQVREHGEFAVRGGIIDLYPMGSDVPYRIELFENQIESIRTFSQDTQRSLEVVSLIKILPGKEYPTDQDALEQFRQAFRKHFPGDPTRVPLYQDISDGIAPSGIEYYLPLFYPAVETLFDYLAEDALVVTIGDIEAQTKLFWQHVETRFEQMRHQTDNPLLPPLELFIKYEELQKELKPFACIAISDQSFKRTLSLPMEPSPEFSNNIEALSQTVAESPYRVLFSAESLGRLEILERRLLSLNIHAKRTPSWYDFINGVEQTAIIASPLLSGFVAKSQAVWVITETELYGKPILQQKRERETESVSQNYFRDLSELKVGDSVVHLTHGVGRYLGLETIHVQQTPQEFLAIAYFNNDKLYVPVDSLHLISRYSSGGMEHAPLHKLGSQAFQKSKKSALKHIQDIATDLLELYAKRASNKGHAFLLDEDSYAEFAAQFPFEETPDQRNAINQVIKDMLSEIPMDRVICGDVGFGKTEVAMRAAFVAAHTGKQVAVLVPTTLLAEQHYQSFIDRFAKWPIRIASMSRFKNAKQQTQTLQELKEGKCDIIIGTHKLIQENVHFRALGLIIIDEEHRFGVKQKEKLKSLRTNVDCLALTATPIPRTLNMALSGIRELSIIATPPSKRLKIKTFLYEYHRAIIEEAIRREIMRGGQVYFLHNNLATIDKKASEIETLVPEARVVVAHGQLHERLLEKTMYDFYHRRFNVLVCSTIIESGIDIPTANTIIINDADHFGIAQLHQLRGRVGRSHHQAYAYLLVPSKKLLTTDAEKRLDAFTSLEDLGIGFTLATHDLEIRGAGELLGEEQSGNMHEIGFNLYMDLLNRAVQALKSSKPIALEEETTRIELNLGVSTIIPNDYIYDIEVRLQFYNRIAAAKDCPALDDIQVEMIDRFGLLPESVKSLIQMTELRQYLKPLGIKKIDASMHSLKIEFCDTPSIKAETVIYLIQNKPKRFQLEGKNRLKYTWPEHAISERITMLFKLVRDLHEANPESI